MKITSAPHWRPCRRFASWGGRLGALPASDLLRGGRVRVPQTPCEPKSPGQVYDLLSQRPSRHLDKNVVTFIRVLIAFPEINPGLVLGVLLALGTTYELVVLKNTIIFVCTGVSLPNPLIQQLVLGARGGWEAAPVAIMLGCRRAHSLGPSDL